MSVFIDSLVRVALDERLLSIGTQFGDNQNERVIDLGAVGIPKVGGTINIQIVGGESPPEMEQEMAWVEAFLLKSPQFIRTPSEAGLSLKLYQYVLWVKTDKLRGTLTNEVLSGCLEEHFHNNLHLPVGNNVLTILKTYQQPVVIADNETGRLFNRVSIDCEIYYKNNN